MPDPTWATVSGSRSSSSRPIPPGRSTSATAGGGATATPWPGYWPVPGTGSAGSTTSTTPAGRSARWARACWPGAPAGTVPEGGYAGEYVTELAGTYEGPDDVTAAGRWAADRILDHIRATLASVGIVFDEWYSQASIEESGAVDETIALLAEKGLVFEQDGATWFRATELGDSRDRVLRKSNGDATYLAGDLAYHRDKFLVRGFDRVIDVFGADHHGQVASLKAGVQALGVEPGRLEVKLGQMVSLMDGDEAVKMGKRAGNAISLDSLVADIGPDATRILSLMSSLDQATTFDLASVREQSVENPVFYVQMASARIGGVGRKAAERGIVRSPLGDVDLSLLTHPRELELIRCLEELPEVVAEAAVDRAPTKVTTWVRRLAGCFHGFYHDCPILADDVDPALTQARLWLVEAARIGLAIGLGLLGVTVTGVHVSAADRPDGGSAGAPVGGRVPARPERTGRPRPPPAHRGDRRRREAAGGRVRPGRLGRTVRHAGVRLRRGPPSGPVPRGGRGLGRRRGLRHQGLPVHGHGPPGPRGGDVSRRVHRGGAPRGPGRRGRRPPDWCSTATTSPTQELAAALAVGVGRIVVDSFDEIDRLERLVPEAPVTEDPAAARRRGPGPGCWPGSRPAWRSTPTSSCVPARTTPSSGSAWPPATAAPSRRPARRACDREGDGGVRGDPRPPREPGLRPRPVRPGHRACWPSSSPRSACPSWWSGGGLGVPYVNGEEAPPMAQWAGRRCARRAAGPASPTRSGSPAEPGRAIVAGRRHHPLPGRDGQGRSRPPHLRRGRRGHERQPPRPCSTAAATRRSCRGSRCPPPGGRPGGGQALRDRRRGGVGGLRPGRPGGRGHPGDAGDRAPTGTRWRPTTTRSRDRRWSSWPTARPASSSAARPSTTWCASTSDRPVAPVPGQPGGSVTG